MKIYFYLLNAVKLLYSLYMSIQITFCSKHFSLVIAITIAKKTLKIYFNYSFQRTLFVFFSSEMNLYSTYHNIHRIYIYAIAKHLTAVSDTLNSPIVSSSVILTFCILGKSVLSGGRHSYICFLVSVISGRIIFYIFVIQTIESHGFFTVYSRIPSNMG